MRDDPPSVSPHELRRYFCTRYTERRIASLGNSRAGAQILPMREDTRATKIGTRATMENIDILRGYAWESSSRGKTDRSAMDKTKCGERDGGKGRRGRKRQEAKHSGLPAKTTRRRILRWISTRVETQLGKGMRERYGRSGMRAYLMIHFLTRGGKSRGGGHEEGTRREGRDTRKSGSPQSRSDLSTVERRWVSEMEVPEQVEAPRQSSSLVVTWLRSHNSASSLLQLPTDHRAQAPPLPPSRSASSKPLVTNHKIAYLALSCSVLPPPYSPDQRPSGEGYGQTIGARSARILRCVRDAQRADYGDRENREAKKGRG